MTQGRHSRIGSAVIIFSASVVSVVLTATLAVDALAQSPADTARRLQEVVVRTHFIDQPLLRSTSSIGLLTPRQLENHHEESLVPSLNSIPGIRMEERSPGSYRLSVRGSLLRSPFGIRNIRIYMDEYPLTDAGGNSYLNLLGAGSVNRLTILKGPEASIFGANTGGVILIDPFALRDSSVVSAGVSGGSYGLFHQRASLTKQWDSYLLSFNQGYQRSDGYRENSSLSRNYSSLSQKWQYAKNSSVRSTVLFSDLDYETPGGLTSQQAELDPRQARQATTTLPGAEQQHAGVRNTTLMGGIVNESVISKSVRHIISLYGSFTGFKNPFITNYEQRRENSAGFRTYFEHGFVRNNFRITTNVGAESQLTNSDIQNFDNEAGRKGTLQSHDKIKANQTFYFVQISAVLNSKLILEVGSSVNNYTLNYRTESPLPGPQARKRFSPQWMPRTGISYLLTNFISARFSASRGYSPPTIAEVRASDNVINTRIQPETGWNYETGLRLNALNNRIFVDVSAFSFGLRDAIVRRVNENDTEFFINAGGTTQKGMEVQLIQYLISPNKKHFVRSLELRNALTFNNFKFKDYMTGPSVFTGNRLAGVPGQVVVSSLDFQFPSAVSFFIQHNYTSSIPLNDANNTFADDYHLLSAKWSWKPLRRQYNRMKAQFFAGADNILDSDYSLGNDLNAAGNRYFNPAPGRNFYAGVAINWK